MARFNEYFKNHWEGCRLLAEARDNHRNRDVRIYMVPGEFDIVGVSDGTDAWVAPVAIDPFSVSVKRILEDIRAGKDPRAVIAPKRRRIAQEATVAVMEDLAARGLSPTGRRVVHEPEIQQLPASETAPRIRRVIRA